MRWQRKNWSRYVGVVTLAIISAVSLAYPSQARPVDETPESPMAAVRDAGMSHHMAAVNGVRLHYVTAGQGDPIVLLHGWPQTWYQWRKVMPLLAETHRVIAVDMRGFGDSSKPTSGYDFRTVANDISGLIKKLGLGPVHVVGHDMGAVAAYRLAADHADQVRTLTYVDEPLPGFSYEQLASGFTFPAPGFWFAWFNRLPADLTQDLIEEDERRFLTAVYGQLAPDYERVLGKDGVREYVRQYSKPGAIASSTGVYREIAESAAQNRESAAQKLETPVLAMGAERGLGTIPAQDMRQVARDVTEVVVPGSSHYISEERPEYFADQLLTFIGRAATR